MKRWRVISRKTVLSQTMPMRRVQVVWKPAFVMNREPMTKSAWLSRIGWIRSLAKRLVVLDVEGAENIPATGALLLTTSHISRLDTPFLMLSTERKDVIGVVAQEYQRAPFFGWVLNALRVIWISRGENDMDALREVMSFLSKGWVVGIAPEGRRSRSGQLEEGKPGAALI
ncbi:MAG: 1-acyl-sn-glycerol-3-phosphate acyltransferase, partial [Clostridia bacterium]|nr:1-acyl-sn-glycerol-3-phosphate acyltransferase [Clostridia bacterium]